MQNGKLPGFGTKLALKKWTWMLNLNRVFRKSHKKLRIDKRFLFLFCLYNVDNLEIEWFRRCFEGLQAKKKRESREKMPRTP